MREIKFRGKSVCKKYGEWVYGYLIDTDMIQWKNYVDNWYDDVIYENTVGEYIGLKDINKKEVYEGDIIKFADSRFYPGVYKVVWEGCGFAFYSKDDKYVRAVDEYDAVEVVGNIYDNPELMEGE